MEGVPEDAAKWEDKYNFAVRRENLKWRDHDSDWQYVVRTDTDDVLGLVNKKYKLVTHNQVITKLQTALEEIFDKVQFVGCKTPMSGARMFSKFRIGGSEVEVKKGDLVGMEAYAINSYDRQTKVVFGLEAVRLACENGMLIHNQLTKAINRHYTTLDLDDLIKNLKSQAAQFPEVVEKMKESVVEDFKAYEFAKSILKNESFGVRLRLAFAEDLEAVGLTEGVEYKKGKELTYKLKKKKVDLWTVYNLLTRYTTHHESRNFEVLYEKNSAITDKFYELLGKKTTA